MKLDSVILCIVAWLGSLGNLEAYQERSKDYYYHDLIERAQLIFGTRSFYQILGVDKSASVSEINLAYRKKSFEWHPDRNAAGQDKFTLVSSFIQVIRDEKSRQRYDWILTTQPFWNRDGYYMDRPVTARFGLWQVAVVIGIASLGIYISNSVVYYLIKLCKKRHARQTLLAMNRSEYKKLERRMEKYQTPFHSLNECDSRLECWIRAHEPVRFELFGWIF